MIGGTAVGNIPTKSSYFGKCYFMRVVLSAGGTGDHRISFDPTSLRRTTFLGLYAVAATKVMIPSPRLGTTCKLRMARDEYVSSTKVSYVF